jgi:hypothetical protein
LARVESAVLVLLIRVRRGLFTHRHRARLRRGRGLNIESATTAETLTLARSLTAIRTSNQWKLLGEFMISDFRSGLSLRCHFERFLREISRRKSRFLTSFGMTSESPADS